MNQGRPKKVRFIQKMPSVRQFSPRGKPGRPEEVILPMDEFEALKLSDFQLFSQSEGAVAMKLSRASFGRSLRAARKKIADALVNGKIIKIQMGDAQIGVRQREAVRPSSGKMGFARISGLAKVSTDTEKKELVWNYIPMLRQYFSGPEDKNFVLIEIETNRVEAMTPHQKTPDILSLK